MRTWVGPRNWVISQILGDQYTDDMWADESEWVVFDPRCYFWQDWPELWTHLIHDYVECE